jgi:hypothetical protein
MDSLKKKIEITEKTEENQREEELRQMQLKY